MMKFAMLGRSLCFGLTVLSALLSPVQLNARYEYECLRDVSVKETIAEASWSNTAVWLGLAAAAAGGALVGGGAYALYKNSERVQEQEGQHQYDIVREFEQAGDRVVIQMPALITEHRYGYRELALGYTRSECMVFEHQISRLLDEIDYQLRRIAEVTGKNGATSARARDEAQRLLPGVTSHKAELRACADVLARLRANKFDQLDALHALSGFMGRLESNLHAIEALVFFLRTEYGSRETGDYVRGLPLICAVEDIAAKRQQLQSIMQKLRQHIMIVNDAEAVRALDLAANWDQCLLHVHNVITSHAEFRYESALHHEKRLAILQSQTERARAQEYQARAEADRRRVEAEVQRERNRGAELQLAQAKATEAIVTGVALTATAAATTAGALADRARAQEGHAKAKADQARFELLTQYGETEQAALELERARELHDAVREGAPIVVVQPVPVRSSACTVSVG